MITAHLLTQLLTGGSARNKPDPPCTTESDTCTTDNVDAGTVETELVDIERETLAEQYIVSEESSPQGCESPFQTIDMYDGESEMDSCTESRLDSSFSKSHIYEKLVRKQMSNNDPELASILKESEHSYSRSRTPTKRGDGSLSSSGDPFRDSQGSYGRRTPTNYSDRHDQYHHRENNHSRSRTPTHSDHGGSLDHYRDLDFPPIGNRSISVDNLHDRRNHEVNNDRMSGQSERNHSYDYSSGRRSVELRNHREITQSSPNVNSNTRQSYYSDDEHKLSSDHRFPSGLPPTPPSRRAPPSGDRRSVTPDPQNHNGSAEASSLPPAQPVLKSPLVTTRTTPIPSTGSRPSSRSSIPIVPSGSNKDDTTKIQDLEDTIVTLKKLLSDRDKETNVIRKENQDLHATNCQLKTQLEEFRKEGRKTPTNSTSETEDSQPAVKSDLNLSTKNEYERKINQLINERENLETEMWKLRQQLGERGDGACETQENGLDNYTPNNPYALQRKIDELQSQIQDMQEANETTASHSAKSDLDVQKLKVENEKLKEELATCRQELEAENRQLREELEKLKSMPVDGAVNGSLDELTLQSEVHALRQDLRFLRDKNHQLNEDNIKLIEHLQDLRRREKEQLHSSPQSHIPRGILDNHEDKLSSDLRSSAEFRKFSPIPTIRSDKDNYQIYSPPSKYSSGNLHPSSRKHAEPDEATYKYEHFNRHRDQSNIPLYSISPTVSESSDCTATLATAHPNGYVADEGPSDTTVANGDVPHDPPPFSNVSRDLRSTFLHDLDTRSEVHNPPHTKPRSILRKKEATPTMEYGDNYSNNASLDRYRDHHDNVDLQRNNKRRGSTGSTSSLDSILDELEQEFGVPVSRTNQSRRSRTRSAGSVDQRSQSSRCTSPSALIDPANLRSLSPKPSPNQHNRGLLGIGSPESESFSTLGKRPFAPRTASDIHVHDIVKFARQGGRICRGLVKFIGHLPGRNDTYLGVELDKDDGKHDGTFENVRYFKCKANKGVFVAFNKVVMAWGS